MTRYSSSISIFSTCSIRHNAQRYQEFIQILQLLAFCFCWICHALTFQCHMTQQTARSTIRSVHRAKETPLIWKQFPHCGCLHLHEELTTMNTSKVCTES